MVIGMLSALIFSVGLAAQQTPPLTSYEEMVRCAGLTQARIQFVRLLSADNPEARAALQRCRQRTPDLG